jgi:ribonuclease P protein component
MLPIARKISRDDFPHPNTPTLQWTGEVLRVRVVKKENSIARFAIIAAKKHYRTKITRNRFKRRVFSVIKEHLHKLDTNPHGFFLIFPVIHTQKITFSAIKKDLEIFVRSF